MSTKIFINMKAIQKICKTIKKINKLIRKKKFKKKLKIY